MNAPVHPINWHELDRQFLARVKSATLRELRQLRRQFEGMSEWRSMAIRRAIDRLVLAR